jgi:hypothetical protein
VKAGDPSLVAMGLRLWESFRLCADYSSSYSHPDSPQATIARPILIAAPSLRRILSRLAVIVELSTQPALTARSPIISTLVVLCISSPSYRSSHVALSFHSLYI